MAVDWSTPQPSYEELHADIDALKTERNAAVAESKLWLQRVNRLQEQLEQARAEVRAADENREGWVTAYTNLLQDFRRLEVRFNHLADSADDSEWLLKHLATKERIDAVA